MFNTPVADIRWKVATCITSHSVHGHDFFLGFCDLPTVPSALTVQVRVIDNNKLLSVCFSYWFTIYNTVDWRLVVRAERKTQRNVILDVMKKVSNVLWLYRLTTCATVLVLMFI